MVLSTFGAHAHISFTGTVKGTGWSKDSLQVTVGASQGEENSAIQTRVSQQTAPYYWLITMGFDPRAMCDTNSGTNSTLTMLGWSLSLGQVWISPSQKITILILVYLPTAISQSRWVPLVPICAATLSTLWGRSSFEQCLWFPQDNVQLWIYYSCCGFVSANGYKGQRVKMNIRPCC